ncbi:heme biosynthesis protein HemY [Phreatobacter oligotrophus]|uniref:HemY protein n=1 Tax=Phreatobacter oligotrophus TaxID=1122261 RepID=A0A2T4ZEZ5_9HYPH|nr:heme biosynthesis HemY N-terminal domain-containing protein [Phreatobacter oligotrophus]PTM60445.1 HemY protein [Phreatobacter oligotrophus]
MVRVVLFLVLLGLLAFGAAWVADQPGTVSIVWLGRHIEFEVLTGIVALVAAAAVAMALIAIAKWLLTSPAMARRAMRRRRARKGSEAVTRGILAVGAGDRRAAERHAHDAEKFAPGQPLTLLLKAQTAQLSGDRGGAEQAFRTMVESQETRLLGLRGLYVEAQRRGDQPAARAIAEEAVKDAPSAAWASQAVLESQTLAGDWDGALTSIERQYAARTIDREKAKRLRAVLLTAKAMAAEDHDPAGAKALALEAHGLAPTLVPAAVVAGRLLAADGDARKASRVLEASWKATPHPDIAEVFAHARRGDSRLDELKRVEHLARLVPSHPEGAMAVARAAIDAGEFERARKALEPLVADSPTQRACLLMAELSAKDGGDHGRAREWMARALRAARDPVWTADGQASDVWFPASLVSGRLDAFEWKVPVAEIGGPVLQVDDVLADHHESEQPAVMIEAQAVEAKTIEAVPVTPEVVPAPPAEPVAAPAPAAATTPAEAEPAAPQTLVSAQKPRPVPTETVFPIARPPDDPGPDLAAKPKRASLFGG